MSMTDNALRRCPLSAYKGDPTTCRWCATSLVGRQTRWCSNDCAIEMLSNHRWDFARKAALQRDHNQCQKCGWIKGETASNRLEVDHKKPCLGKHGKQGCWHHLAGLMTLCHYCHLAKTGEDRFAGRIPRPHLTPYGYRSMVR